MIWNWLWNKRDRIKKTLASSSATRVSHLPLSHAVLCSDSKPTEAVDANSKSYRILRNSHAKSPYKDWGPICALGFPSMRRPCPRLASPYRLIRILRMELSSPMPALPPCCQAIILVHKNYQGEIIEALFSFQKILQNFLILCHIKSVDVCMKY